MDEQTQISPGYLSSLWNFFASVKLTVVVLLSLAFLSSIGTLIPQNQSPDEYFRAFGAFRYQIFSTLDIFDMYHSWWFQLLIVLLLANIIICSIERLRITAKIIFVRNPEFNLKSFRQRKSRQEFTASGDINTVRSAYQKIIAKGFGYCRVEDTENGFAITAEKGRWTRLGVYGVHLSVVILLVGGLIGSLFGFEGYVNIVEGETASTIQLRNSNLTHTLPFAIRCDEFEVQFYSTGAPKLFRSDLVILEKGQPVVEKAIVMNDPLRYKGINIFQSSWGESNQPGPAAELPDQIELQFDSAASGMSYTQSATIGQPVEIPEGLGQFTIQSYQPDAKFKDMDIGPALMGTLTAKDGSTQDVLLAVNFPKFDGMRRGKVIISVAKKFGTSEKRYYTGLQVTRDPGVWVVYVGFILMIAGCVVTFFMSHQQIVVEGRPHKRGTRILAAGTANKNKFGYQQKLERLSERLAKMELNS